MRGRAAVVVVALLVAGCQAPAPVSVPSSSVVPTGPAPRCTASPGASAAPCSEAEYAEQRKQDALYEEAERVYRAFLAESDRISRAGSLVTPRFLELVTGDLADDYSDVFAEGHAAGYKVVGGDYVVKWIRPAPSTSYEGSVVALESCVDARSESTISGTKTMGPGRKVRAFQYFVRVGDSLRLSHQKGKMGDSVC